MKSCLHNSLFTTGKYLFPAILFLLAAACWPPAEEKQDALVNRRVNELLSRMTTEEKIGQLNQLSDPYQRTGTGESSVADENFDEMIARGQVGSFLNVLGARETMRLQKIAVEKSRLGIPLLFGYDVIHGYKTVFPVPLGEAASFDRSLMEKSARIAAIEASASGVHWTFAPMVDISRDPRWGRIMEGAGEDVYLGEQAAMARVHGFQGNNLADSNTIAACAKHFAAYGAPVGGRDYNSVDLSERMLREVYLRPYQAAVKAGVATLMSSFNTVNGVPASGNRWLQTDVLRGEWHFDGFVVSDWNSLGEMLNHGNAESPAEVALRGINAGVDMDMEGRIYITQIQKLIDEKKVSIAQIDEMVARILRVKFRLGLFDHPYQYCDTVKEKRMVMTPAHIAAAKEAAEKSFVLLKNNNKTLPLSPAVKRVAVIGPLADDKEAPLGNWRGNSTPGSAVSLLEGLRNVAGNTLEILHAEGCRLETNDTVNFFAQLRLNTTDRSGFADALAIARKADLVILAMGETSYMTGECRSYADISLKGLQAELLHEIKKTGKPLVLVLFTGRPLVLTDVVNDCDAILNCWLPGSQSGNAIAEVLTGKYNPSGKLPASFPWHVGQIPVYYETMNTGRPYDPNPYSFSSKYRDIPNEPLFPFGFGLSYTTFEYSRLSISPATVKPDGHILIKATITNSGDYDGEEVVELYIRDVAGKGVSRPLKELMGFEKLMLRKGERKEVTFELKASDLAFYRLDKQFAPEAGMFEVFVGPSSDNFPLKGTFELTE